ncbi:alpha/beta hydrolase [Microbacterium gorillae]|uniref:alpha/beta hydrolase n=1 Tax=Microbacterium gorillae TaxID=1231063 RepID=UPI00058D8205|nr:alpha/beta hydrolase [Microbacterium gorillae]
MTATRLRRLGAALVTLAVASLTLTGCLYSQIPKESAGYSGADKTPSTVGVPAGLEKYYSQTVDWSSCAKAMQCGTVSVPLDYADPSGASIDLALVRARPSGTPQGSLLVNPGGPGASGVDFVESSLSYAVAAPVRAAFDIVGFDPRGVGKSSPVKCLDGKAMDEYLYAPVAGVRGSQEWLDDEDARAKSFADACEANSGKILPFITTENAAKDMDVMRAVLGDDKLNYLGYSYGTKLGATYAGLFPERVGRLVLDGALDPEMTGDEVGLVQAKGFQTALTAYMQNCLDGSQCPFTGTVDQALGDLRTLLDTVDANPLPNSDGRKLDGADLSLAITAALYSEDSWSYLTEALAKAMEGDPSTAFFLADFYNGRQGPGKYEDNSTEAFNAYNCMDYQPSEETDTESSYEDAEKKIAAVAPTIAKYWLGADVCEYWAAPPTGKAGRITADGAAPIVVVGTTNDPATPYEWAVALSDQLSSGVLITRKGDGHTGYNKGNSCVDDAVNDYFTKRTVPTDGLTC